MGGPDYNLPSLCFFSLFLLPLPILVLVYRCINGSAPDYLASDLQRVSHLNARQRLRS